MGEYSGKIPVGEVRNGMLSDKLILFPPAVRGGGGGAEAPSSAKDLAGFTSKNSNNSSARQGGGEDYSLRASSPGVLQRRGESFPSSLPHPVPPILAKAVQEWQMSG